MGEVVGCLPEGGGGRCGGAGRAGGALGRGGGGRLGSREEGPPIAESTGEPGKERQTRVKGHHSHCTLCPWKPLGRAICLPNLWNYSNSKHTHIHGRLARALQVNSQVTDFLY